VNTLDFLFFGLCALLTFVGGVITVAARNPIRSAMGLLTTILGIAGLYLMLSAEFLAAVQLIVYAGAVVVLFIFVIMLLGPASQSSPDARSSIPRYIGAGVFLVAAAGALGLLASARQGALTRLPAAPPGLGTIDAFSRELFTAKLVPFELSGALLLIAVIGAVAVARGKQVDPTLAPKPAKAPAAAPSPAALTTEASASPVVKEAHS
jgi:NADH-quinone oxidoreductase subunit J